LKSGKRGNQETQVIKTEELYRGKVFTLAVENLILPNGRQTEMAMIRHPGSTGIIPIDEEGNVVMIRQYRPVVDKYLLEIPAGTMEPGESAIDCARRELEEETGLQAQTFTELMGVHILPSYSDEKIHIFLACQLTRTHKHPDPDEIIETETYSLASLLKMIRSGRITDALTILSIQNTFLFLQDRKSFQD
jgi:ADP-ribose pyrophosphatase